MAPSLKQLGDVALHEFEPGKPVVKTGIKVTNAGDGLSNALAVDPQEFTTGDTVNVVLECVVARVEFEPIEDGSADHVRLHVLRAGTATIVDADLVAEQLRVQADRVQEARDAAAGIQRMQFDDDPAPDPSTADGWDDALAELAEPDPEPDADPEAKPEFQAADGDVPNELEARKRRRAEGAG